MCGSLSQTLFCVEEQIVAVLSQMQDVEEMVCQGLHFNNLLCQLL